MAIMGASGSGKVYVSLRHSHETSLLNLLVQKMRSGRMKVEGQFNGNPLRDVKHAYVAQQDILLRIETPSVANSSGSHYS